MIFFPSFARFLILLHNVVPVSLLATVQVARLASSKAIKTDVRMGAGKKEPGRFGARVQNSQLNEVLGKVNECNIVHILHYYAAETVMA